ncbi:MAG: Crp/Fnr family transcriptional regulator [Chloroflexi bacterium]|nr:Crp/Fnr family transcriptional regulator [Chloroflexota bacterium]MBV9600117.1 Crp/Fnr family transcriptional regulator [Chloroflexota bacterium]
MTGPTTHGDSVRGGARRSSAALVRAEPEQLASVGLFADLSQAELSGLAALMRPRSYAREEVIYLRGDPGTAFYVIASGKVKIALTSPDGKELILRRLGPGDFHGELALLDDEPRSADAIATDSSVLLVLQRDAFRQFLAEHPAVATKLLATVSHYLRRNAELIQDATFLDVPARLARVLLELAGGDGGDSLPPAGAVIPDRMKQAELASLVGATRESVNKWLGSFERQGLISIERGRITLLRPGGLRQRIY